MKRLKPIQFGIRAQLAVAVCLGAMFCLGVLSVATYVSNSHVVLELREDRLKVIAQLKQAQVVQTIGSLVGQVFMLGSSPFLQGIYATFYQSGTISPSNTDFVGFKKALSSTDYMVEARAYSLGGFQIFDVKSNATLVMPANATSLAGLPEATTGAPRTTPGSVTDPLIDPSSPVNLPPDAFPVDGLNWTQVRNLPEQILVGPFWANSDYFLSLSQRISTNSPSVTDALNRSVESIGYLTVVTRATALLRVLNLTNTESTGIMALIEVADPNNATDGDNLATMLDTSWLSSLTVDVSSEAATSGVEAITKAEANRLSPSNIKRDASIPTVTGPTTESLSLATGILSLGTGILGLTTQPTVLPVQPHVTTTASAVTSTDITSRSISVAPTIVPPFQSSINGMFVLPCEICSPGEFTLNSFERNVLLGGFPGALIDGYHANGHTWSVGYALAEVVNRRWGVIIFQVHGTIYQPLFKLRNMLLISVFCIGAGMCVVTLLLSSIAVKPIRRLQSATEIPSPAITDTNGNADSSSDPDDAANVRSIVSATKPRTGKRWYDFWRPKSDTKAALQGSVVIPETVVVRRRIRDELTDLADAFNDMTEELRKQYTRLEDRVAFRTKEIEGARLVAEDANKAKSLFIANITHELRTPLNGIMGMASVAMESENLAQMKDGLRVIFKSGELLLHLLTDLLTFSKSHETGHMHLDEKEFMVPEVLTQLHAIFGEHERKKKVALSFVMSSPFLDRVVLWGDINRVLQIAINLVSNSLKFTPAGGKISLTVSGCLGHGGAESDTTLGESDEDESPLGEKELLASQENSPQNNLKNTSESPVRITSRTNSQDGEATPRTSQGIQSSFSFHGQNGRPPRTQTSDATLMERKPLVSPAAKTSPASGVANAPGVVSDKVTGKALSDNGQVEPEVSDKTEWCTLSISVQDTGPGIAPHLHDRVFLPFDQGDLRSIDRHRGAGLGLSICRHLATLMRGTVELESELGRGSTFTFRAPFRVVREGADYLTEESNNYSYWPGDEYFAGKHSGQNSGTPITTPGDASQSSHSAEALSEHHGSRPHFNRTITSRSDERSLAFIPTVLLAEDNKVNQEVMVRMLELEGIRDVTIADDGVKAVECVREAMAQNRHYDVVFMDVQMPHMDGLEATGILRKQLGYSGVVVGVSAYADETNVTKCLGAGMNKFLAKPLRRPLLHKALLEVCDG